MLATEFLHLRYPNLPTRVLKAAVSAYVGPTTLVDVAAELGLAGQGILRWNKDARLPTSPNASLVKRGGRGATPSSIASTHRTLLSKDVAADSMRALIAVVFSETGLSNTRAFVTSHFLTRSLNLAGLLKFNNPKLALASTCKKYGKQPPQSRMVAESGRLSISPVFVVGVWSGETKLGEASGSSIKMAEFRAAEDALRRLYLAEVPMEDLVVPSCTMDEVLAERSVYTPQPLGETEVLPAAGKNSQ